MLMYKAKYFGFLIGSAGMIKNKMTMSNVGVAEEIEMTEPFESVHSSISDQPGINPGFLNNQIRTTELNRTKVDSSWKVIGPRS